MFQRVLLNFVLKVFGLGAENETRTPSTKQLYINIITCQNSDSSRKFRTILLKNKI